MEPEKLVLYALQAVGGGFCSVLWFNYRLLLAKVDSTAHDLALYKVHIAENYVTQNELTKAVESFNRSVDGIIYKLGRIEDKLDSKQDKA